MRTNTQPSPSLSLHALAVIPLCGALALGCVGQISSGSPGTGNAPGTGSVSGTGGSATGSGGAGSGGAPATACTGPSDPRTLVAPQRVMRLTYAEMLNVVRYLTDSTEAQALLTAKLIGDPASDDDIIDNKRQFPPLQAKSIIGAEYLRTDQIAEHVSKYVLDNYATVTMALGQCNAVTDACATTYLGKFAARAYRRALTSAETGRVMGLYTKLKSQTINDYLITTTVQEATSYTVLGIMSSPEMLWRWEIGNAAMASTSPPGIPLTDAELATQVSFFLNDQPPDDTMIAAANGNTLRANLATHVNRLLGTQQSKDWLRTIVETYYLINKLTDVTVDPQVFPIFNGKLLADMRSESTKFLDNVLWGSGSQLTDLLTSRTSFVNTNLATNIYMITPGAGATDTNFVQTTLPSEQRSGLLTNAAFITSRGRSDGKGLVVPRGRVIVSAVLCMPPSPPPDTVMAAVTAAKAMFATQTGQQQVESRNAIGLCASCHAQFDPYGLVLENYDTLGRWRTNYTDLAGSPVIDAHTNMPAALGGDPIANANDLSQKLAASPQFVNCMARTMLQYGLVDFDTAEVELPLLPQTAGCAAADVATRFKAASSKNFTELVRATTETPAFSLRIAAQ